MSKVTGIKSIKSHNTYDSLLSSHYIVYSYREIESGTVVYYGKDTNGHRQRRHISHMAPARKNDQVINKELQNNPEKYVYTVEYICADEASMDDLEASMIAVCQTFGECKFNQQEELKEVK